MQVQGTSLRDGQISGRPFVWRDILPGLAFIVLLDGSYLLGGTAWRAWVARNALLWQGLFLALPLAYVLWARRPLACLGFRREWAVRWYVWGMGVGALWRLLDVLLAVGVWSRLGVAGAGGTVAWLFQALILVPLVEETFFRAYLQAGLQARLGLVPALLLQAMLFAGHPGHVAQGPLKLPSIFLFGLLAGLLYARTRSMAALFGAHGLANVLPGLIARLAGALYGS